MLLLPRVTPTALWQRYMGTVEVSLVSALIIIGVIAGIVSAVINYLTLKESTIVE